MTTHRRRVRHVVQYAQSECGLCCSAMILDYWGSSGAIHQLRKEIDTGRDGLSLGQVARLLRSRGLDVQTYQASVRGLRRLTDPAIIFWEENHVVVLESINDRRAVIVDPSAGRRSVALSDFERSYSGIVLGICPGENFTPLHAKRPPVWRTLLAKVNRELVRAAVGVALMSIALYSVVFAIPLATEKLIGGTFPDLPFGGAAFVAVVVLVPVLIYLLIGGLRALLVAWLSATLGAELMRATFEKLLTLPYRYFATRSQGELMYRLGSLTQVRDAISSQLLAAFLDAGLLIVALTYVFLRAATLGWITLALVVLIVALNAGTYRKVRSLTEREIGETAEASGIQMESLSSIVPVKTSGMLDRFFSSWWTVYRRATELGRKRNAWQGVVGAAVSTVQTFGPFLILVSGLALVSAGYLDLGVVVAAQALASTALGTTTSLSATFMQFVRVHSQVERVGDIILQESDAGIFASDATPGELPPQKLRGDVEVVNLGFSYPGSPTPALRSVSFRVAAGERLAVVGASGSGKSTLGKLLVGLYGADSGLIAVDGTPLRELTERSFREAVAYVPQDVLLSNRTIAGNIDFTAEQPDLEVAARAAAAAQVLHDIQRMPLGLNTEVREMGANMSGGQRQRIALARALARKPSVLVLDEATSALDAETEALVSAELERMACTQIVIAHRLSTVLHADAVLVLDEGEVVQFGNPQELMHEPGRFRELVTLQMATGTPSDV